MYVKSLDTDIPNQEGIEAVKEKRNAQTNTSIATKVMIKFLFIIFTLNTNINS